MYDIEVRPRLDAKFRRLARKDRNLMSFIGKKIDGIRLDPHRFKNLRNPMQHMKRVHIDSSFVLIFSVDEERRVVILEDFDHHDRIYR